MIPTLAFFVAFLCLLEAAWLGKDFFSPLRVYVFTQTLTLGVAFMKLDPAMTDWHVFTWVVFGGGMLGFVMGALIFNAILPQGHHHSIGRSFQIELRSFRSYNWRLHCLLASVLFLLYAYTAVKLYAYAGGLPVFSPKLSTIMGQKIGTVLGLSIYFFMSSPLVIMLFGVAAFRKLNPEPWLRNYARTMVVVQLVALVLFHPARNTLFMAVGVLALLWNYIHRPLSSWLLLGGIVVLIMLFVMLGALRSQYSTNSLQDITLQNAMSLPYKYVANNFWNLDYALNPPGIQHGHPATYGLDHLAGGTDFVLGNKFRNAYGWDNMFNKSIMKVRGLNTVNYLWEIYKDFREPGVVLIPFAWAFAASWLLWRLTGQATVRVLILHCLVINVIGLWWFNILYKNGLYWMWVAVILGVTALCQRPPRTVESTPEAL